jgi:hypothetical protein
MKPAHPSDRATWSSRPHFSPRQLLTAEQLNAGLDDELHRQRLLSRAVHGYGVVTGFGPAQNDDGELDVERGCFHLSGGLALDRHGRMLYWAGGQIGMDDIVGELPDCDGHYTLCAHYAVRRPPAPGCLPVGAERTKWWHQGVVFTLRSGCEDVDRACPDHPDGACPSSDHYLCRRTGAIPGDRPGDIPVSDDVPWVLAEPGPMCTTDDGAWEYDPDPEVCVPLGCFEICDLANDDQGHPDHDHCEPRYGFCPEPVDACAVRPLVYRNPLLHELTNCCDVELARVEHVSWQDWLDAGWSTPVPWRQFARRIIQSARRGPKGAEDWDEADEVEDEEELEDDGGNEAEHTDEHFGKRYGFEIWFSHPIKVETINDASIFLTAVVAEDRTDYLMSQRVPLRELTPLDYDYDERLARGVRLVPERDWIRAEIRGRRSTLFDGARFELTVRGQLLRDRCGQTLDARPLDITTDARGQARPGGDFVSAFQVGPRRHPGYGREHEQGVDDEGEDEASGGRQPSAGPDEPVDVDDPGRSGETDH